MKSIKPIALKEAKILSNEEMKLLFGGSGGNSNLEVKCGDENTACNVTSGGMKYSGTCTGSATDTTVSCYCEATIGGVTISGADSACMSITL